jgi:hypothetical protein
MRMEPGSQFVKLVLAYRAWKMRVEEKSFDRNKCNTKFLSLRASFSR